MDVIDKFEAEFGFGNKFNMYVKKCDKCSTPMNFGWVVGDYEACGEKCAVNLLGGQNRFNLEMKIWNSQGDNDNVYYTHWECMDDEVDALGFYYNEKGEEIDCTVEKAQLILINSDYFKGDVQWI